MKAFSVILSSWLALHIWSYGEQPQKVRVVGSHSAPLGIPKEARLTMTAYPDNSDIECGNSEESNGPYFQIDFVADVGKNVDKFRFETTLLDAGDFVLLKPKFVRIVGIPVTKLGTRPIVSRAAAYTANADSADKAMNAGKLSDVQLKNALYDAEAALKLATEQQQKSPSEQAKEQKLRAARAKAAILLRNKKPVEAVKTLRDIELPQDRKVRRALVQERFDAFEAAMKSFKPPEKKLGMVSGAFEASIPDRGVQSVLEQEFTFLTDESKALWPYSDVSVEAKLADYREALSSDALANENLVRVALQRSGVLDLKVVGITGPKLTYQPSDLVIPPQLQPRNYRLKAAFPTDETEAAKHLKGRILQPGEKATEVLAELILAHADLPIVTQKSPPKTFTALQSLTYYRMHATDEATTAKLEEAYRFVAILPPAG